MKSFFMDTATKVSTIAILDDLKIIDTLTFECQRDLSTILFSNIQKLFLDNNVLPDDIKKIYVSIGPGSFTGIRVGLSIAKTWSSFYNIPICPLSTLEILASASEEEKTVCSMIDARRGYVFAGIYDWNLQPVLQDTYISLEKLQSLSAFSESSIYTNDSFPFATMHAKKINIIKLVSKHRNDFVSNPDLLKPIYLKNTEAEEQKEKELHAE